MSQKVKDSLGKRCLVKFNEAQISPSEVKVLEISPSGKWVKWVAADAPLNRANWDEIDNIIVVETFDEAYEKELDILDAQYNELRILVENKQLPNNQVNEVQKLLRDIDKTVKELYRLRNEPSEKFNV